MPCIDMIGTGRNIAAMCKAHGMTMTQMADRIGVTPVAVSKWKTGRNMPTKKMKNMVDIPEESW